MEVEQQANVHIVQGIEFCHLFKSKFEFYSALSDPGVDDIKLYLPSFGSDCITFEYLIQVVNGTVIKLTLSAAKPYI